MFVRPDIDIKPCNKAEDHTALYKKGYAFHQGRRTPFSLKFNIVEKQKSHSEVSVRYGFSGKEHPDLCCKNCKDLIDAESYNNAHDYYSQTNNCTTSSYSYPAKVV